MTYDIIQHLATVDVFEYHVVVMLVNDHFAHAAHIWVVQEHGKRSLPQGPDFFGCILCGLSRLRFGIRPCCAWRRGVGVDTRQDLDSELGSMYQGKKIKHLHLTPTHLFTRNVMRRQFDFAHAPGSKRLAQGVIS